MRCRGTQPGWPTQVRVAGGGPRGPPPRSGRSRALAGLREKIGDLRGGSALPDLAEAVVAGTTDPYTAADRLVGAL